MNEIRSTFLETSAASLELLGRPEIERAWEAPSALERLSVRGLAGHVKRATGSLEAYLDRPAPQEDPITAAAYYADVLDTDDLDSPLHAGVRDKGEAEAAGGWSALVRDLEETQARLRARLESEPSDRLVRVFKDLVLRLDDYLITRVVELAVHIDDLAVSVGLATPAIPARAYDVSIDNLVGVARHRHGDLAVLRALTRRERDAASALRVM